jgi:2'-5' RNA ligase
MSELIITLPEVSYNKLNEEAARLGLSPGELVRASIEERLSQPDEEFEETIQYVLQKNAVLYRRLGRQEQEGSFDFDTYVVLDLPSRVGEEVMAIRERYRDWFRASFPAEITVAGSGGVGVFDSAQDWREAISTLHAIAAATPPIQASFEKVLRFPNTDIFVFALCDESPFRALHERIATSGLRFKPSPFPYTPHCTLYSQSPVSDEVADDLLSLRLPGTFTLDTMSVYMLNRLPCTLLHRMQLGMGVGAISGASA